MNTAKYLELLSLGVLAIIEWISDKQTEEPEKEYKYIASGLPIFYAIYLLVDWKFFENGIIFSVLQWIQNHFVIMCIYIIVAAVLPSAVASIEQKKGKFQAKKSYALANLMYNFLGVLASGAAFLLAHFVIRDFSLLKWFYIEDIIPMIVSVCIWMALIYQKTEWKKYLANELDHDASLKSLNQKLNLIHLFNMYFLAITSVVYLVAYTIYCQMYHMNMMVNAIYFILLSIMLLFFYALSQHRHRYLYQISIIIIPVILISSIYWMTWFSVDPQMRICQHVFVVGHSMLYIYCIFKKEKIVTIKRNCMDNETDPKTKKGRRIRKHWSLGGNLYMLIFPVIIIMMYIIVLRLPLSIDRLPGNEAYNYIGMVCADTNIDAEKLIEKAKEQKMYDKTNDTYDVEEFMKFMSKELGRELLDQGIIEDEGDIPTRDVLNKKYVNKPRY